MRLLRGLLGAVLWILGGLVGLLGLVLCLTVILLPLGIPLIFLSRRLFGASGRVLLPRRVRHPLQAADKSARKTRHSARKRARKLDKSLPDLDIGRAKKKARKFVKRQRNSRSLVG